MAITDNLISYWDLSEASGTRLDSVVASANDLNDNNTVTGNPGPGSHNASQFTIANSESLSHVDNASLSSGNIDETVVVWAYLDAKATHQNICNKWNGSTQNEFDLMYETGTDKFALYLSSTGADATGFYFNTLGSPSLATWYFLMWKHDSVNNLVLRSANNGTVDSTAYSLGIFDSTAIFRVGARSVGTPDRFFGGRIAMLGFWKRILTTGEITTLYNAGSGLSYAEMTAGGADTSLLQSGRREF